MSKGNVTAAGDKHGLLKSRDGITSMQSFQFNFVEEKEKEKSNCLSHINN